METQLLGSYDLGLVALSYVVASMASFGALDLAGRVTAARGAARAIWLGAGSVTMGFGIWGMHFVGMLAFSLPTPIRYDGLVVFMSFLPAVVASALALFVASRDQFNLRAIVGGSLAMGTAISGMHYIGMAAVRTTASMSYRPGIVTLSVVIAVAASAAALWLAFNLRFAETIRGRLMRAGAGLVMGAAIAGMHYTGMAAVVFTVTEQAVIGTSGSVVSESALAVGVAGGAILVTLAALLASFFDRKADSARLHALNLIMTIVTVSVAVVGIGTLYGVAQSEMRQRLSDLARGQAQLIGAVARFDAQLSAADVEGGASAATIMQLTDAHRQIGGFGETGEYLMAQLVGDEMVFLLDERPPAPFDGSEGSEAMRRALAGESGTLVGFDYRGEIVLAAYESVDVLDLGIVAKMDLAELRAPFIRTGLLAGVVALGLIALGTFLFARIGNLISGEITEIKTLNERLASATEAAQAATKAKSAFLANMSHEIRTPMNAILGFSQLMSHDPRLPEVHRERVRTILRSGDHLLGLINDVLEMSKIEAGRITLAANTFDLREVLKDIETMFRVRTDEKGLELSMMLEDSLPQFVHTDEGKLKQVIINLLGNAVKFTDRGGITVRARSQNGGAGQGVRLRFDVEDTGFGIAEDEMDSVFAAFEQTEAGRSSQSGTGLGMPISQEFAQLMGGDLKVRSEVGVGSTFTLEITVQVTDGDDIKESKPVGRVVGLAEGQEVPLILIVDDKATNRLLLREFLAEVGIESVEAPNGAEALEQFDEVRPDLVFMDLKMPVMDGMEAIEKIRAKTPEEGSQTPVVILTASVFEQDKWAATAGADAFIMKPLQEERIWKVLEWLLDMKFVREMELADEQVQARKFTREDLAGLGTDTVTALFEAIESADIGAASGLLDPLEQDHPEVVAHLRAMIDVFDFDGLLELTGEGGE